MKNLTVHKAALRISLVYTAVATLWVLFSDRLLEALIPDLERLTTWQTLKGLGFVAVTTLLIYYLLRQELLRRQQTEATLEESQRRLSTLMANLPGIAYRSQNDRDWTMLFVSEGCTALTGYQPEDLIGSKTIAWAQLILPADREEMWAQAQHALQAGDPFRLTYRITTAVGQEKWVWEQGQGVYSADGTIQAVEGLITDVTDSMMTQQMLEQRVAGRTHELTTLREVSRSIASTLELEPLLLLILDQFKEVVDYSGAAILMLHNNVMVMRASRRPDALAAKVKVNYQPARIATIQTMLETQQPIYIADLRQDEALVEAYESASGAPLDKTFPYIRSWMGVPLIMRGQVLGMLSLAHRQIGYYEEKDAQLAQDFANQAAIAMHNAELYQQAQKTAVADERSRIARELHDSVTQAIYSVTLYADATRLALKDGELDIVAENLNELRAMAREAMLDMRLLIFELRPPVLEEEGLVIALQTRLEAVEARSGVHADFHTNGERRLPLPLEIELYRIAQEALTNVVKHARAKQVNITLRFDEAQVCLEIADDGVGFDTAVGHSGGMGLRGIQERVEKIGGDLLVQSTPGQGTILRITVNSKQ
ncbi:MAG: PAS domain-containing protein [Ardenticatenaceae bacterium]|nr:PAS domain-containing protein [Anaerolineales bacterium]MCB8940452.1 PAS domain-containing protein [Ardenticatenaceae bacterium]MCB8973468.1 PAS domain-containing protein [Ardenticatenaceae bacterium]